MSVDFLAAAAAVVDRSLQQEAAVSPSVSAEFLQVLVFFLFGQPHVQDFFFEFCTYLLVSQFLGTGKSLRKLLHPLFGSGRGPLISTTLVLVSCTFRYCFVNPDRFIGEIDDECVAIFLLHQIRRGLEGAAASISSFLD